MPRRGLGRGWGLTKQCLHHRFWTKEGPGPWFLHGIGEARQLPGCVGTWLPPPHGAATTGAQVTASAAQATHCLPGLPATIFPKQRAGKPGASANWLSLRKPKEGVGNDAVRLPEASLIPATPENSGMDPQQPDPCPDPLTNASSHIHIHIYYHQQ